MIETNKIHQGDALEVLKTFPDESINCVMTSPPYWGLRDYGEEKQLGLEPTFDLYIKHLCDIFDEVKRVLRKDGTVWVNIGDTYWGTGGGQKDTGKHGYSPETMVVNKKPKWNGKNINADYKTRKRFCCECGNEFEALSHQYFCSPACSGVDNTPRQLKGEMQDKSLCNIPSRFSIEMQNRGWILRNVIIWYKPNCMPCSVKDRFTVDFEYLFFFVKNKNYWFETQYEPLSEISMKDRRKDKGRFEYHGKREVIENIQNSMCGINSIGRNKRTVWSITTKGFPESHFAVYPEELCETPIRSGCPEFVCNKCGKPREKIILLEREEENRNIFLHTKFESIEQEKKVRQGFSSDKKYIQPKIKDNGYTSCGCNDRFSPGVVLDMFFGSGTTGLVSLKQNKKFIGIELNPKYIEIANRRLKPYLEQTKLCVESQTFTKPQSSELKGGIE